MNFPHVYENMSFIKQILTRIAHRFSLFFLVLYAQKKKRKVSVAGKNWAIMDVMVILNYV